MCMHCHREAGNLSPSKVSLNHTVSVLPLENLLQVIKDQGRKLQDANKIKYNKQVRSLFFICVCTIWYLCENMHIDIHVSGAAYFHGIRYSMEYATYTYVRIFTYLTDFSVSSEHSYNVRTCLPVVFHYASTSRSLFVYTCYLHSRGCDEIQGKMFHGSDG